MKLLAALILLSACVMVVAPAVRAENASGTISDSEIGMLPGSPFYFLKLWYERVRLFFTFGDENKAQAYFHLAEVRFAEYQRLVAQGKDKLAQETIGRYENDLKNAQDILARLAETGADVKNLAQKIQDAAAQQVMIIQRNIERLQGIRRSLEEAAKFERQNP
ncbi:MAG: hypothetical protein UY96_C0004G0014 [Parcubacteria group bacterium GW2011_GWB1_56_8]|nr:MAG: hypothetical protein UY96_C0004G0014 [Parcubacteria group bacterium GW2011_GWB1_56_8]